MAEGRRTGSVRGGGRVDKVEGPVEEVGGGLEGDVVGPSNVLGGERDRVGFELDALEVFDDTVGGRAITVPERPPAAILFGEGRVGQGRGEEVAVIGAIGRRVGGKVVGVDLNKGVLGSKDVLEAVGDEEESVGGSQDGSVKAVGVGVGSDEGRVEGCRTSRSWGRDDRSILQRRRRDGRGVGRRSVGGIEEVVIVGVAAEGPTESDGQFGDMQIEEALIGAVRRFAGPERGR